MSRGPGDLQRAVMTALADRDGWATVSELAADTITDHRQTRAALRSLEAGGHVTITRQHIGWKGRGKYGSWALADGQEAKPSWRDNGRVDDPADVLTIPAYEDLPNGSNRIYLVETRWVRRGVPVSGLVVELPQANAAREEARERMMAKIFGPPDPDAEPKPKRVPVKTAPLPD